MRFRGGGVGHTSTRAATNVFKADRDVLDMKSHQGHQELEQAAPHVAEPSNFEEEQDEEESTNMVADDSEDEINEEGQLSESELVDYGYEGEDESDSEEEGNGGGEEDDTTIDELDVLGYADY